MAESSSSSPTTIQGTGPSASTAGGSPEVVDLVRIHPYDRNPRQGRNPEYDRIKDSIRSTGLDQPLVITQRPGTRDYIVHAGGNTRLTVLKELFDETGDARFGQVPCLIRPWNQESDVLLAHLRENDLRGGLTFIDKARAVLDAKELLAEELGLEEISQRRLAEELRRRGYRITHARISQMEYAVQRLLPVIPLALEQGLGRPQVEQIRRLERATGVIWRDRCSSSEIDFDEVFLTLCRRYDSPDWNTEILRGALEAEIADVLDVSIHTVRMMLDAELEGRRLSIPENDGASEDESSVTGEDDDAVTESSQVPEAPDIGDALATPAGNEAPVESASDDEGSKPDASLSLERDHGAMPESDQPLSLSVPSPGDSVPTDLKSLRGRAWTLAARLAQRNGMGELVEPVPGKGLGFVLRDVPDPTLADQLDEESLSQLTMLWWQLAACSEMTFAPLESILPLLPEDSILRRALETEDAELLFSSIWTLDPGHTGYRLWRPLHDRDWSDLLGLMDTYRRIRLVAADTGVPIWE